MKLSFRTGPVRRRADGVGGDALAFEVGIIGFQFLPSETHARVANAAAKAAKAKGWTVTLLNSEGALPKRAEQFKALITKKVDAIVIAMGKPVEADAQFKAAKDKGIPVITVQCGFKSPHALFDIQTNEYQVDADAALYLLRQMGYKGNILASHTRAQRGLAHPRRGMRRRAFQEKIRR